MIVVVGDRRYPGVTPDDLSLLNVMALQRELTVTNISRCQTWEDVQELWSEVMSLAPKERTGHPEMLFVTSLLVWMARVSAGERIDLLDAVDVPMSQIGFILEPHDHAPKATAPTSRKGSVRGASSQHRNGGGKAPSTSGKKSTAD